MILQERGRSIDIKTLRRLTYHFADTARSVQQTIPLTLSNTVAGKRCAVSVDGGRIRIRTPKQGKKTSKKRSRFKADWREPKLLHIWLLEGDGTICRDFAPWIDGTLNGPDAVFMLLGYYLTALNITSADQVLFIADGAPWIWARVPLLIKELGLDPAKVYQIVDFYHAVEHLNAVAKLCKRWPEKRRRQWVSRLKGYLWVGKNEEVVEAVREISRGRNGKLITRERNYFEGNIQRMQYALARKNNLPIGRRPNGKRNQASGESAHERKWHLLAGTECGSYDHATLILQSGTLERSLSHGNHRIGRRSLIMSPTKRECTL